MRADLTPRERSLVQTFVAMELHIAHCAPCCSITQLFDVALDAGDTAECARLATGYCPEMRSLATVLATAGRELFPRQEEAG